MSSVTPSVCGEACAASPIPLLLFRVPCLPLHSRNLKSRRRATPDASSNKSSISCIWHAQKMVYCSRHGNDQLHSMPQPQGWRSNTNNVETCAFNSRSQEACEAGTTQLAKTDCCVSTSLRIGVTASKPRQTICAQSRCGCFWAHTGGKLRSRVRLQLVRPCARHDMMIWSPGRWAMETNGSTACDARRVAPQTKANFFWP